MSFNKLLLRTLEIVQETHLLKREGKQCYEVRRVKRNNREAEETVEHSQTRVTEKLYRI